MLSANGGRIRCLSLVGKTPQKGRFLSAMPYAAFPSVRWSLPNRIRPSLKILGKRSTRVIM